MPDPTPGERAVSVCELDDVFLISSECWVARDCNQSAQVTNLTYGQQSGVDGQGVVQERTPIDGGPSFHVMRYFVNAEVKLLKPGVETGPKEPADADMLAVLKFTLAADYRCPKEFLDDRDGVGAFARNAHFHSWPYIREHVHSACARMRLPRITLPMLKPDGMTKVVQERKPMPSLSQR